MHSTTVSRRKKLPALLNIPRFHSQRPLKISHGQQATLPHWRPRALQTFFNNISSFKNTTNGTIELDTDVLTSLCPNDCSDRGNCSNSTCICDEDYTSPDCSVSLKDSPLIFDIRKSGLCDRRRRPCRNVGIFGYPLLDSENLTCHVQEHKVMMNHTIVALPILSRSHWRSSKDHLLLIQCYYRRKPKLKLN